MHGIQAFHLQRFEKAFRAGVVIRVPTAAHALNAAHAGHSVTKATGSVLTAPVGMKNQAFPRISIPDSVCQGRDGQVLVNGFPYGSTLW